MTVQNAIEAEMERRQTITDALIEGIETCSRQLESARTLAMARPHNAALHTLVSAVASLQSAVLQMAKANQFERGPKATGYLVYPGLAQYLERQSHADESTKPTEEKSHEQP
jgi:hypothetical protein